MFFFLNNVDNRFDGHAQYVEVRSYLDEFVWVALLDVDYSSMPAVVTSCLR